MPSVSCARGLREAGGPAARAGVRPGDVITTVEGKLATRNLQLHELMLTKAPGDAVAIEYSRDGKVHATTVTLAPQP